MSCRSSCPSIGSSAITVREYESFQTATPGETQSALNALSDVEYGEKLRAVLFEVSAVLPTLLVNRPFMFFIRHNASGAILYEGRVMGPSK
jgi:Serpin (serine protease inhibitor)